MTKRRSTSTYSRVTKRKKPTPPRIVHFIVGTDFGTTFSSVSFIKSRKDGTTKTTSIGAYPGDSTPGRGSSELPSELFLDSVRPVNVEDEMSTEDLEDSLFVSPAHELSTQATEHLVTPEVKCLFGFQAQDRLAATNPDGLNIEDNISSFRYIRRAKLLLEESQHTDEVRQDLNYRLTELKKRKIIKEDIDVIVLFLTCLMKHVKDQLERRHGYNQECTIEFAIATPAAWTQSAIQRYSNAFCQALDNAGFPKNPNCMTHQLFGVFEPEAAASYFLSDPDADSQIGSNDSFLLMDIGGGTADCVVFPVERLAPLRLKPVKLNFSGDFCGSSLLNESVRSFLLEKLRAEPGLAGTNLERDIDSIINRDFEKLKRSLRLPATGTLNSPHVQLMVTNFRPSANGVIPNWHGFSDSTITLNGAEWRDIITPIFSKISKLITEQIAFAEANSSIAAVDKIIVVGGFSENPALQTYLDKYVKQNHPKVVIKFPSLRGGMGQSVSVGSVIRASNKAYGPKRELELSVGVVMKQAWSPDSRNGIAQHIGLDPKFLERDDYDGDIYVTDSVIWLMTKGELVDQHKQCKISMIHPIKPEFDGEFGLEELIFASPHSTESYWPIDHPHHEGKLIELGLLMIQLQQVQNSNVRKYRAKKQDGVMRKAYYTVEFDVVIEISGLCLNYYATLSDDSTALAGSQGSLILTGGFRPGTK